MKRLAIAAGLIFGVAASSATAAQVEFRGGFCLTAVNAACAAEGWGIGCSATRYSPRRLGDNGERTRLSYFNTFFAENYTLETGNLVGNTFRTVAGTSVGRSGSQFTSQMRITEQDPSPADISDTSPFVTLVGNIRDFDGIPGCNVTFKASGVNSQ
jgi:hypothetical protein